MVMLSAPFSPGFAGEKGWDEGPGNVNTHIFNGITISVSPETLLM